MTKEVSEMDDLELCAAESLERLAVFDDSEEIAEALRAGAEPRYYMPEAAQHIEGLWVLANELAECLRAALAIKPADA